MKIEKKMEKKEEPDQTTLLRHQVQELQNQILKQQENLILSTSEKEAEVIKKEQAALAREADVKTTLAEAFAPSKTGLKLDEELEQHELISIMGDAVGSATKAQEDLILTKVADLIKSQDDKIDATRKVILELVTRLGVERARTSFDDFDNVRSEVKDIMIASGLDAEDAYLLHKARIARSGLPNAPESERPEIPPSAPSREEYLAPRTNKEQSRVPTSAKQAFKNATAEAIDKVLAARQK